MKRSSPGALLFATSVVTGVALWAVFAAFQTEPWDTVYGWIAMTGLGIIFGFLGKGNPIFWPLGIFLGEILFGVGGFMYSILFPGVGGVNFFFPLGLAFLVPFSIPCLIGSIAGYGLRGVLTRTLDSEARSRRAG